MGRLWEIWCNMGLIYILIGFMLSVTVLSTDWNDDAPKPAFPGFFVGKMAGKSYMKWLPVYIFEYLCLLFFEQFAIEWV